MPLFILAKGNTIRWTEGSEGLKVLHLLNERDGANQQEESELDALRERAEIMKALDSDTDE